MAWKEVSKVDQRTRMIERLVKGEATKAALAREYGVSRTTIHAWGKRYCEAPEAMREAVMALRRAHPYWGPKKLKRILEQEHPEQQWPAASTIGALLWTAGLVMPRRRRQRSHPGLEAGDLGPEEPNQQWCADFKGVLYSQDGQCCDPLTITDAHSRYLLCCQLVPALSYEATRPLFEAAFQAYGLPRSIRSDNGPPFGVAGVAGLTRLAIWWIRLGIYPVRIAPGHPQQNGKHERMHRTLQRETPAAGDRESQQQEWLRFQRRFNHDRPHEALQQRTPAEIYRPSSRVYPERLPPIEYGSALTVRKVKPGGQIKWQGEAIFVSRALQGYPVGLQPIDQRCWQVWFSFYPLAWLDTRMRRLILPRS